MYTPSLHMHEAMANKTESIPTAARGNNAFLIGICDSLDRAPDGNRVYEQSDYENGEHTFTCSSGSKEEETGGAELVNVSKDETSRNTPKTAWMDDILDEYTVLDEMMDSTGNAALEYQQTRRSSRVSILSSAVDDHSTLPPLARRIRRRSADICWLVQL